MKRKPDNITFWLNDRLPIPTALSLSLQQLAYLGALLIVPSLFANSPLLPIGSGDFLDIASATLLIGALAIVLQITGRWGLGAGYYYPMQATPSVLAIMLLAGAKGGLAVAYGMVFITGLTQFLLSGVLVHLRNILTVEVAGLAVMLTGVSTGKVGIEAMFIIDDVMSDKHELIVAGTTLAVLVFCSIWVSKRYKAFATLFGLAAGTLLAASLGMITDDVFRTIDLTPWVRIPDVTRIGWQLDTEMIGLYVLMGISLSGVSLGAQTMAQRALDADWHIPDLKAYGRGLRAEGLCAMLGSFINAMPQYGSGGAVGLSTAAGSASRYLGYWVAGALVFMALFSKFIVLWMLVPPAVIAGLLLYLSAVLIMTGLRLIASRMLDDRRAIAIGLGLMVGVANPYFVQGLSASMPAFAEFLRVAGSSTGVLLALMLTLVFRFGAASRAQRHFPVAATTPDDLMAFMQEQGRLWGARRDSVMRVSQTIWEAFDLLAQSDHIQTTPRTLEVQTRFDDYALRVRFLYRGVSLPPPPDAPPSPDEILDDPRASARLSSYLVSKLARRMHTSERDGQCQLDLYFDA
ncbi:MAG: solute carrier family 23 protein [Castellaniella sp.]